MAEQPPTPGKPQQEDKSLVKTKVLEERQKLKRQAAVAEDVTKVVTDPTKAGVYFKIREQGSEEDKNFFEIAALIALVAHLFLLFLILPDFDVRRFTEGEKKVIKVLRLPPKQIKKPPKVEKKIERKKPKIKPVPDPTPEEPEEVVEEEPEPEFEIPDDVEVVFGEPEGPPLPEGPQRLTAGMVRPKLIKKVEPVYPPLARKAGLEGTVVLEAIISETGDVEDVRVLRSMGKNGMDEAAIDAVKQWKFTPALSTNGKPLAVYMTLTVSFRIR